ncbi:MAG TPA: phosphatidylglycerophosphatase A [Candidatus Acidoferrum sp.]|nr:phosphatidylglycerophosphatase A [Candidatus Acidoferrum sp.]
MTSDPAQVPAPANKPRISYFIATGFGLGYLKPGPGTWGSLLGVGISIFIALMQSRWWDPDFRVMYRTDSFWTIGFTPTHLAQLVALLAAIVGVYSAGKVENFSGKHDPQFVVIDEVSGQLLAFSIPFLALNWKSWLLGFILFRVFDIWKPFPARQAERLPGGWGIMTDDWVAGIYAALGLWAARALGLLA